MLVIIDIQDKLAAVMDEREKVVSAGARMARVAALLGAPIIATRQYPEGLGGTVEALDTVLFDIAREGARVVEVDKRAFCCTAERGFRDALMATGRRQVVIAGMETHICVTQTSLALNAEGFEVYVAADACCSRDRESHNIALDRMRSADVIVTTSESVMYEAVGTAATDEFRQLLRIVKS